MTSIRTISAKIGGSCLRMRVWSRMGQNDPKLIPSLRRAPVLKMEPTLQKSFNRENQHTLHTLERQMAKTASQLPIAEKKCLPLMTVFGNSSGIFRIANRLYPF